MAHLYWVDPDSTLIPGGQVSLEGEEAHHASRVARLREGELVRLGNSRGSIAMARALRVSPDHVALAIEEVEITEPLRPELWLIQALAKSGRDEAAIETATEVGVSGVIPLQSERTIVQWKGDKAEAARGRWERIVREAAKQSLQPWVAPVGSLVTPKDLITQWQGEALIVLDPNGTLSMSDLEPEALADYARIGIVVGPEGGFSSREMAEFDQSGALRVRLGPGILRASSAGPIGLAILHYILGHWRSPGWPPQAFVD